MFLAAMRDKSKKQEWEHKPPVHLSTDGVDAWYMTQRRREKEMKQRRKEAEQLLRGYRGPYFDDQSVAWSSPRHKSRGRASFGDMYSDSLSDPAVAEKRRQSTMPRLQGNWDNDDMSVRSQGTTRSRLGPERTEFLNERQHYDGTTYGKIDDRTAYANGKALFHDADMSYGEGEQRDAYSSYDGPRFSLDHSTFNTNYSSASRDSAPEGGMGVVGGNLRNGRFGVDGEDRDDSAHKTTRFSLDDDFREYDAYNNKFVRNGTDHLGNPAGDAARFSVPGEPRETQSEQQPQQHPPVAIEEEVPETIWRDFISPGMYAKSRVLIVRVNKF